MAWSIATAARGSAPDYTLCREPSNEYTTRAQQWFIEQLLALEPGTQDVDGGGYAHKPGYHDTVAHNDARSGKGKDYSADDAQDRRGPRNKTRARDWTFRDAQAGNFADFARYGDRVLAAYRDNDPRLNGWREYLGRVSKAVTIDGTLTRRIGIDFRYRYLRIPSQSHDWHAHVSEDTEQVESFANKWALLTVLAGWTTAQWRQSLEDDMNLTDKIKLVTDGGVKYSTATTTVSGVLASTNYYVLKGSADTLAALAAIRAGQNAVLSAVKGLDTAAVIAAIDARAAQDADRDAKLLDLIGKAQSGELNAADVVAQMGKLLYAAVPDETGEADVAG